ncbi:MAG: ribosome-associated translation inhibitor RaiA [Alphaproteobacteria bacterium]|nr:MAG: ribosome-associated translation inhibitor RaiA [Alphaproteobacteria bacterium]
MQVKITGKNLDIGAALRAHIENRIFDIAEKYFNGSVSAHVTLEKQRSQFTSDCTLHLATGLVLQAHGQGVEAMPSYDKAASHLAPAQGPQ